MAIVRTKLKNGANLIIETDDMEFDQYDDYSDGIAQRSVFGDDGGTAQRIMECGKNLLREAVDSIRTCAEEVASGIEEIKDKMRPDEVEASMAFKLNAEAGAIITKLGGEAQLQVTLVWKNTGTKR